MSQKTTQNRINELAELLEKKEIEPSETKDRALAKGHLPTNLSNINNYKFYNYLIIYLNIYICMYNSLNNLYTINNIIKTGDISNGMLF